MTHSTSAVSRSPSLLRTRRVASVVAGLISIVVLSSVTDVVLEATGVLPGGALYDTGLLLLATAYRIVFSVFGCYLAARLAPDLPMRHALALGGVGVVFSLVGTIVNAQQNLGPAWYPLTLVAVAMPCAFLGGKLATR
jgi:hypothetical protein